MRYLFLILIILLFQLRLGATQLLEVPAETQAPILWKIMTMERNLCNEAHKNKPLRVAVVYQNDYNLSRASALVLIDFLSGKSVAGRNIEIVKINAVNNTAITNKIDKDIDVVIVAQLRAINLKSIFSTTRKYKILSMAMLPEYIDIGATVAIEQRANTPGIAINMESYRLEGVKFNSHLLKLAKIIK